MQNVLGKFITIEGCEGVGKSTQTRLLKEYCEKNGVDAVFTREPGGTAIAEKIRKVILDPECGTMDGYTELLLYAASRCQHTRELILPALKKGITVFCDRYADSTLAYQGWGRGLDKTVIAMLNRIAMGEAAVDYTVFIDVSPEAGFLRKGGADKNDRIENETPVFHRRVYEGFCALKKDNPDRFIAISATGSKFETHGLIVAALKEKGVIS